MRRVLLLLGLSLTLICAAAAKAHELSSSTARAETRFYAESLIEDGIGLRYRVHSCRRHSGHAVSCAFRIYGRHGFRCGGRVRTSYLDHASPDTVSRLVVDRCR
jgi:hypothetical protein